MISISRLNYAASVPTVYASSSTSLHSHARLVSGWWLAFTERESNPLEFIERFPFNPSNILLSQAFPWRYPPAIPDGRISRIRF